MKDTNPRAARSVGLLDLPEALLMSVIGWLARDDVRQLHNLRLTCKHLRDSAGAARRSMVTDLSEGLQVAVSQFPGDETYISAAPLHITDEGQT